jgi:predicted extracellular nuclease
MSDVLINEFHYDNDGADTGEFIEIAGPAGTDLTGWSIVLYNGSNGSNYNTTNLSSTIPDQSNGFGTVVVNYPTNGIQNGAPDGIALVDDSNNVVQFLSYEGSFTAVGGPADGMTSTDIGVIESSSTPVGFSLQLTGTGTMSEDFSWNSPADDTPGAVNDGQSFSGGSNPGTNILINEIDADQASTDSAEFIELYDGGTGNTSLDNRVVVLYNGSNDTVYDAIDLDGQSTDANGYFVIGSDNVPNVDLVEFTTNGLQNGADAVALYTGSASDFPDGTPVTTDNLIDAIVYDTNDADDAGLLPLLNSGEPQVDEASGANGSTGDSLQRIPNGNGGLRNTSSYEALSPTPGAENTQPPTQTVAIPTIQGTAHTSPLNGESVTTTGIVTAVDSNGFYLQDPTGDGDIATSDAIFVFTSNAPGVSVGDELQVEGTVSEFTPGGQSSGNLSITQISSNPTITTLSTGNALPAATIIGSGGRVPPSQDIDDDAFASFDPTTDGIDFFESLEAMRVTAQDPVAVAPTNRFGEIFTVVDNGASATGLSDRGTLNISPDDFNPEKVQIDEDTGIFDFDLPNVDAGASLGDVTGVVSYSFGNFEILPTEAFGVEQSSTLQPESTALDGTADQLTLATYNVLNLDPNDSDGDTDIADGRFDAIAGQIVNNLNTPDIIGLQEVQDNSGSVNDGTTAADQTLQTLVDAIALSGGPGYEFIDNTFITNNASGGQPGGNIRTAFLYDPNRVSLVDGSVQPIGSQAPGETFNGARLPLVAAFDFNGQEVTVINNHFSSKGGSAPIFGVEQNFADRQEDPTVNGSLDERREQAQEVNDFVDNLLANDADDKIAVLGDLNEFEFVSPLQILAGTTESANGGQDTVPGGAAVLTNLVNTIPDSERYSFIFQGNSQQLDHILVSDGLVADAEIDIVNVNTEFVDPATDHDPVVASLTLDTVDTTPTEPNVINGTSNDDEINGTDRADLITANNGNDTVNARGGNDTVEGGRGGDIISGGAGDDILAADRRDRFDDFDGEVSELRGGAGKDTLLGGSKNDFMIGGRGNDQLFGKSGNDVLNGGAGDDLLNGGVGNDRLRGGNGTDTADYSDLTINGVFGTVAGLDANLRSGTFIHSSTNNALTWTDTVSGIENVTGTERNDRFISNAQDNVFNGQGEVGRSDRQTEFTDLNDRIYTVTADVAEYRGSQSDFTFVGTADNFTVTGGNNIGTDTLIDIEFIRFNGDQTVVATTDLTFA